MCLKRSSDIADDYYRLSKHSDDEVDNEFD
jgi:hypothetical protein